MSILFTVIVIAICLGLIGYPLISSPRAESAETPLRAEGGSSHDKEVLMGALGEIEFDYQMNKLSHQDYQELKGNYSAAVAAIYNEQKTAEHTKPAEKVKRKLADDVLSEIEKEIEAELQALR